MIYSGKRADPRLLLQSFLVFTLAAFAWSNSQGQPVALTSPGANDIVGGQLKSFQVDADGVIGTTEDRELTLNTTEGKSFKLSGQVWLGGPSQTSRYPADAPDGFAVYLREVNPTHRYELSSRGLVAKRIKVSGALVNGIDRLVDFAPPALGEWLPFSVEATPDGINFQLGEQHGVIPGPLDADGTNEIYLVAGTKIKDLQLAMLAAAQDYFNALVIIKGDLGQGTGFIAKYNGQFCVITNQHVLSGNSNFKVTGIDGTTYSTDGALFGAVGCDVAMLNIQTANNFITIDDNSDADAKIDDQVLVLGNAEGGGVVTRTTGKVLGIGPQLVEIDAKFVHGNSGSPIIDSVTHKVIGIATYVKKTYTPDDLQRAANAPSLRWFGYRLDTIKQWQQLDVKRFDVEGYRLVQIQNRTDSLIELFQQLKAKTPEVAHFKDKNVDEAYADFLQSDQRAIAANSKRNQLTALKNLMTTLSAYLDNDTNLLKGQNLYSFHADELRTQLQIREVIRQGFQDVLAEIQAMN